MDLPWNYMCSVEYPRMDNSMHIHVIMPPWKTMKFSSYIMGIEGQFHPDPFLIKIFDDFVKITASNSVKLGPKFQGQFRPTPNFYPEFR